MVSIWFQFVAMTKVKRTVSKFCILKRKLSEKRLSRFSLIELSFILLCFDLIRKISRFFLFIIYSWTEHELLQICVIKANIWQYRNKVWLKCQIKSKQIKINSGKNSLKLFNSKQNKSNCISVNINIKCTSSAQNLKRIDTFHITK